MKETVDRLIPQAAFIHVKDTEHAQGKRGFLLPGEGTTDYSRYSSSSQAAGYRGDIIVEVSSQVSNKPGLRSARRRPPSVTITFPRFPDAKLPRDSNAREWSSK